MIAPNEGTLLLVEDNPDEVELMTLALEKAGMRNPLQIVRDGQRALDYLQGLKQYADRGRHPLPCLVFLDLRLPRISGLDVLQWMKGHPKIKRIPVIVLTSSRDPGDIETAYDHGANSFLTKPAKLAEFVDMVKMTAAYWITGNRTLPSRDAVPEP